MCTVSWLRQKDGYLLLCNRDERHTRRPALGPRLAVRNEVSLIAPVDGDHGGSWIGINQFGLTLCLLNRYGDDITERDRRFTSRGLLLLELLDCARSQQVSERVSRRDLAFFQPFTMVALAVEEPAMLIEWTGNKCIVQSNAESNMPITSSSMKELDVIGERKKQFQTLLSKEGPLNAGLLYQFHRSHVPVRGPYSVCMHREDAATVSLSAVSVTPELTEFSYYGGPPCLGTPAERIRVERISAAVRSARSTGC